MSTQQRKRLGDMLIEAGVLTLEQLNTTLADKQQNVKLGDALLERGFITEQQLIEVLEIQLGIEQVSLYRYPIDTNLFSLIISNKKSGFLIIFICISGVS